MTGRFVARLATLSICLAIAGAAHAADPAADAQAERSFADGEAAFASNDFRRAAEHFEEAYRLVPHYAPLWNAARAWQRVGERARAANLYARYLREATENAKDRANARASLLEVQSSVALLEIPRADFDAVFVDAKSVDSSQLYVEPGVHVVVGRKGDREATSSVTVVAKQVLLVQLALEQPGTVTPPKEERPRKPLSPWFVVAGGVVTVAAGTLFTLSGLDTLDFKDKHVVDNEASQENLDRGNSKQLRTNILIGVTAVAGVATAVIALTLVDWGGGRSEAPTTGKASPKLRAAARFDSVSIEGTF